MDKINKLENENIKLRDMYNIVENENRLLKTQIEESKLSNNASESDKEEGDYRDSRRKKPLIASNENSTTRS